MPNESEWVERARAARKAGRTKEALRCYVEAMADAHKAGDLPAQMHHGRHAADLHRQLGNFDEAHVLISVTLGFYRENPPTDLELANTLRIAALVEEAFEDDGRRVTLWREAGTLYARAGVLAGVDECRKHLS